MNIQKMLLTKRTGLIALAVAVCVPSMAQKAVDRERTYTVGVACTHEFVLDGYVRVREWDVQGHKMGLRDLGMTSYPALQVLVQKRLRKNKSIALIYDHFFMRGSASFDYDIAYNGTIINGRKGIDVSPTQYNRLTATFSGPIVSHHHFQLNYKASLVIDHITFYLNGEVRPASPSTEVFERFGRQAFPYPVLGAEGRVLLNENDHLNAEIAGTYIPKFKSFYTEGGNVDLHYRTFLAAVSYTRGINDFEVSVGARLRYMHLFQESMEDTNILSTLTAGPYVGVLYNF